MPGPVLDLSVYLVTDAVQCRRLGVVETVAAALKGGVTAVQLRDKQASDAELVALGRALRERMNGGRVPLIVNDRIEVALAIGADGVHVGQSDAGAPEARERLGPGAIVGLSVQTVELARAVDSRVVDYVGVGPVFATATKPDHSLPLGFDGLAKVCAASPVPAVAIGGIGAEHLSSVLAAGAVGAALVSTICAAADPERAARTLSEASRRARASVEAGA
jgi:thiamine-phosphate pyrophosphorylase